MYRAKLAECFENLKQHRAEAFDWVTIKAFYPFCVRYRYIYQKNTILAGVTVRHLLFMLDSPDL